MKNFFFLYLIIAIISCKDTSGNSNQKDSATAIINDTISRMRKEINSKPVASFSKSIPNSLNNWHFSVNVYETVERFRYLMKLEYMELKETDTLKIPNIGIEPKIEIRKGSDDYSC